MKKEIKVIIRHLRGSECKYKRIDIVDKDGFDWNCPIGNDRWAEDEPCPICGWSGLVRYWKEI